MNDLIAWIEIETTGLDPLYGVPLEIACVITDAELREIDTYEAVLAPDLVNLRKAVRRADKVVQEMHTANGLWDAVLESSGQSTMSAERDLLAMIKTATSDAPTTTIRLGGSSVHFDRAWLEVWMPGVLEPLHHRVIDVSSLAFLADQWTGCGFMPKAKVHRAMPDVRETIAEAAWLRSELCPEGDNR